MPKNIGDLLTVLHILLNYGRHLTYTLERRAAGRGFSTIAQFFGTACLDVIYARVTRGIMRILVLEKRLLARAARGRNVDFSDPPERKQRSPKSDANAGTEAAAPQPGTDAPQLGAGAPPPGAGETQEKPPPPKRPRVRRPDPDAAPDLDHMPSMEELEAESRHHTIGCALANILRDLGVAPSLCNPGFWNLLFEAITWTRGNLPALIKDFRRREVAFEPELRPTPQLGLPPQTRDGIRRVVGFFIGERPAPPEWWPMTAAAAGVAAAGPAAAGPQPPPRPPPRAMPPAAPLP